ncbi:hypothetical protein ACOMHN_050594 [Nucella lapillus]
MMRTSPCVGLVIRCPVLVWVMVSALTLTSAVQAGDIRHHAHLRDVNARGKGPDHAKTANFQTNNIQQWSLKMKRRDASMMDQTPSSGTTSQVSPITSPQPAPDIVSRGAAQHSNKDKVDVLSERQEARQDNEPPSPRADEEVDEHSEVDNGTVVFNVTAAVQSGVQAQYELCSKFCWDNDTYLLRHDSCYYTDVACFPCFCDRACHLYKDCCPLEDSDSILQIGVQPHLCLEVNSGIFTHFISVIASCPQSEGEKTQYTDDCIQCRIDDIDISSKLVISLDTHAIYCNAYCALCNGETKFTSAMRVECKIVYDVQIPEDQSGFQGNHHTSSFLESESPLNDVNYSDVSTLIPGWSTSHTSKIPHHQDITPLPTTVNTVECKPSIPHEYWRYVRKGFCGKNVTFPIQPQSVYGNETMQSNESDVAVMDDLCHLYSYPIQIGGAVFRNLFCALRDGVAPGRKQCFRASSHFVDSSFDLGVLTRLHEEGAEYREPALSTYRCGGGQGWYDAVIDTCRPVSCPESRVPSHLFCVTQGSHNTSVLYTYTLDLVVQPVGTPVDIRCGQESALTVENWAISHLSGIMQQLSITAYAMQMQCVQPMFEFAKNFVRVKFVVKSTDDHYKSQTDFELKMLDFFTGRDRHVTVSYESVSVELAMNLTAGFSYWSEQQSIVSYPDGSCCYAITFHNKSPVSLYRAFSNDFISDHVSLVFGPFTLYARVLLNETEFDRGMDGSYNLTYANISLDAWKGQEKGQALVVPIMFLQDAYTEAGLVRDPSLETATPYGSGLRYHILTLCCLLVSIVSLLYLLTTYSVFSELRTLPGINTMFLAFWLLAAQLLLVMVPGRTGAGAVCPALGMALHYAWLCVVSWCSTCSYHMLEVFVRQQDRRHMPHGQAWYLRRYVALAHALPALVVVTVAVSSAAWTAGRSVGYGGRVCYLRSVLLVGLAFVLPLGLSVGFNLLLLVLTARAVSRVKRQRVSGTRTERGSIHIYIGLSSLTGLCWVVALVAEIPGCGWLRYVSAVLNGLQGLHLAASYAGSRRVLGLWRHRLSGIRASSQQSSSSSSAPSKRTVSSSV